MSFANDLGKAKVELLTNAKLVFFGSLLVSVPHLEATDPACDTAWTNGLKVEYNPKFFTSLSRKQQTTLMMHETMHIVLEHCGVRCIGMDPELWNKAADYVINLILHDNAFEAIPSWLFDTRFKGMDTKAVYDILKSEENKKPGSHKTPNYSGDLKPGDGKGDKEPSPAKCQEMKQKVEEMVMTALTTADMAGQKPPGKLGADMDALIERLTKPRVPWSRIMDRFCQATVKEDQSYSKPHRKYVAHGYHLPSLNSPGIGRLMWANDISGSVSTREWNQSLSEMAYIFKRYNPQEISVIQFNTHIVSEDVCKSIDEFLRVPFRRGGGTDVQEVIEKFAKDKAEALFVFTDGHLRQTNLVNPRKPVLWLIYDNPGFVPKFGRAIHFSARDLNF